MVSDVWWVFKSLGQVDMVVYNRNAIMGKCTNDVELLFEEGSLSLWVKLFWTVCDFYEGLKSNILIDIIY